MLSLRRFDLAVYQGPRIAGQTATSHERIMRMVSGLLGGALDLGLQDSDSCEAYGMGGGLDVDESRCFRVRSGFARLNFRFARLNLCLRGLLWICDA